MKKENKGKYKTRRKTINDSDWNKILQPKSYSKKRVKPLFNLDVGGNWDDSPTPSSSHEKKIESSCGYDISNNQEDKNDILNSIEQGLATANSQQTQPQFSQKFQDKRMMLLIPKGCL